MTAQPRLVVSAPSSGHGKTAIAVGLLAACAARGVPAAGFKVGPDHTDAAYLGLAAGRPGRNLDPRLVGAQRIAPLFAHGAAGAQLSVVEGAMGLFDSLTGQPEIDGTAAVAASLRAPVVLVIDVAAMGNSIAALVHGFRMFDEMVHLGGVILNRVASSRHEQMLRTALDDIGMPVLGALRRGDLPNVLPSRSHGPVPVAHRNVEASRAVRRLGEAVVAGLDIERLLALATSAPALPGPIWTPADAIGGEPFEQRPVVALAGGPGAPFTYVETAELLTAAGADVVVVDPLRDESLPAGTRALIVGAGLPEGYAEELSANRRLCNTVAKFAHDGWPIVAEGVALPWLVREFDGRPMCGVFDASAYTAEQTIAGYREATAPTTSPLAPAGARITGYKQHRAVVTPRAGSVPAWTWSGGNPEGYVWKQVHASQLGLHWAAAPEIAKRLVAAAIAGPAILQAANPPAPQQVLTPTQLIPPGQPIPPAQVIPSAQPMSPPQPMPQQQMSQQPLIMPTSQQPQVMPQHPSQSMPVVAAQGMSPAPGSDLPGREVPGRGYADPGYFGPDQAGRDYPGPESVGPDQGGYDQVGYGQGGYDQGGSDRGGPEWNGREYADREHAGPAQAESERAWTGRDHAAPEHAGPVQIESERGWTGRDYAGAEQGGPVVVEPERDRSGRTDRDYPSPEQGGPVLVGPERDRSGRTDRDYPGPEHANPYQGGPERAGREWPVRDYPGPDSVGPDQGGSDRGGPEWTGRDYADHEHAAPIRVESELGAPVWTDRNNPGSEHGTPYQGVPERGGPEHGGSYQGVPERSGSERGGSEQTGRDWPSRAYAGPESADPDQDGPEWTGREHAGPEHRGPQYNLSNQNGPERVGPERGGPEWTGRDYAGSENGGPAQAGPAQGGPARMDRDYPGSEHVNPGHGGPERGEDERHGPNLSDTVDITMH